jgi:hypothetical protein
MAEKDFVVKNGLVVNTSFAANSTQVTLNTINSTSNGFFANSTDIKVGNGSVNVTINSTSFTGTSNNVVYVGTTLAAAVVNSAQLSSNLALYTNTGNMPAFIAARTSNSASYVGDLIAANVVSNAQLSSNLALYTNTGNLPAFIGNNTANNTLYVGTVIAANVVSNAQLSSNLALYTNTGNLPAFIGNNTSNNSYNLNGVNNYITNSGAATISGIHTHTVNTIFTANLIVNSSVGYITVGNTSTNLTINSTALVFGNSTINGILATNTTVAYFNGTSNNALNFDGANKSAFALVTGTTFTGNVNLSTVASLNVNSGNVYANNLTLRGDGTNAYITTTAANGALFLSSNNTTQATLVGNGNLGLGNNAPAHKLSVAGTIRATANVTVDTSLISQTAIVGNYDLNVPAITSYSNSNIAVLGYSKDGVAIYGSSNTNAAVYGVSNTGIAVQGISYNSWGGLFYSNNSLGLQVISNNSIVARFSNNTTTFLVVSANGNVGVNDDNPNTTFSVNGVVQSSSGGFKFPDGSVQLKASVGDSYFKGNLGTIGDPANKGNLFKINSNTLTASVTINSGENASVVGPVTVSSGITLLVESGGRAIVL